MGWQFFQNGKGKLTNLARISEYFQSLGIPFPHANAALAGITEFTGGILLLVGLLSRPMAIPLTILLVLAYCTADLEAVKNIFADPDKFFSADPFLFLYAVALILLFGPGKFSVDWIIWRKVGPSSEESRNTGK